MVSLYRLPISLSSLHVPYLLLLLPSTVAATTQWIQYPDTGTATMTHYTLPEDYIASCGCTAASTHYPTAAMSQMAYGSTTAYGPGCGRCFKVTLLNTYTSDPPFFPNVKKSVVIKVTDLCPLGGAGWCSATVGHPNPGGQYINFDLAWPSSSIPDDFFPSNASFYGYTDFGVWNVSYQSVSCLQDWAGAKQKAALGSVDDGSSVCCPADPANSPNNTCPSFSDQNGTPYVGDPNPVGAGSPSSQYCVLARSDHANSPDTTTSAAHPSRVIPVIFGTLFALLLCFHFSL